jgi:catechol 2,3-dioxygenase-like lactoylglutathione lyase family enzyme
MKALAAHASVLVAMLTVWQTAKAAPLQSPESPPGPVIGACHVSPIVENLDKAAAFYHGLLGLDLVPDPPPGPLPWDTDPGHLYLHGMPDARLRFIGARMPGVRCGIEIVEFNGIERQAVHRRLQDPGAVTLILLVRDIDAVFARLRRAGVPVVTTGGAPIDISGRATTRVVIVKDPDGHYVELAQLDPLPQTALPVTSDVIGIRLRITVADLPRTLHVYRDLLGLQPKTGNFTRNDQVSAMMGMPPTEYRLTTVQFPASPLQLEFIEFKGATGSEQRSRLRDPGSYRLLLNVRGIDAALTALKGDGAPVLSAGGVPVTMTFGGNKWRLAAVPDPNNFFLVLMEPPPARRIP